jgi:hypothetical protein
VTQVLYLVLGFSGTDLSEDPIRETREYRPGPPTVLDEAAGLSSEGAELVAEFRERQPRGLDESSHHPERFGRSGTSWGSRDIVVPGLPDGLSLGEAVLRSTIWRARKTLG